MDTIKDLREKVQGERIKHKPWYEKKVTRKISIYITWLLLHTYITANHVTLTMVVVGWVACYFFILGTPASFLLGSLILQVWWLLDNVDGEIAVFKKEYCLTGVYFDAVTHYLLHPVVMVSIGVGLFRSLDHYGYLIAGGIAAFSTFLLDVIHQTKYSVMFYKFIENKKVNKEFLKKEESGTKKNIPKESFFNKLIKVYCLYPGVMNLITLAALVDFINHVRGYHFLFTFLGILLISYSIFYPVSCIKTLTQIIQKKEIDEEYYYFGK